MKRNSLKVLSTLGMLGLAGVALVSCGKKEEPSKTTPADTSNKEQVFDPSQLIAGFDKNLSGTVKLTYNANYNVDVNSNGGTGNMDSFKHQIRSTTTVEMDLGSDLYIKRVIQLLRLKNFFINQVISITMKHHQLLQ